MTTRWAIVVLAVVGVVVMTVIAVGASAGPSGDSQSRSSLVDRLGDLQTGRQVGNSDLAAAPCPGPDPGTLRVIGQCTDPLPGDAKKLRLCVVSGSPDFIGIKGAQYPLQQANLSHSACPAAGSASDRRSGGSSAGGSSAERAPTAPHDGAYFDLYDTRNSLIVVCPTSKICLLRLDN